MRTLISLTILSGLAAPVLFLFAPSFLMALVPALSAVAFGVIAHEEHKESKGAHITYTDHSWEDLYGSVRPQ